MRWTTERLFQAVIDSTSTRSRYAGYKLLRAPEQTARRWVRGACMSDEYALKAADLLGLDPYHVLTCIKAERARGSTSQGYWERLADALEPDNGGQITPGQVDRPLRAVSP